MRFQIRDETFGLAMYEAETARDALLEFFADRARARVRHDVTTDDAGAATITIDGVTYTAVAAA